MGLLLHQLTKLLKVRVVPKEVKIAEGFAAGSSCTASTSSAPSTLFSSGRLSGSFKQVDRLITGRGLRRRSWLRSTLAGGCSGLSLFLLDIFRNTLRDVRLGIPPRTLGHLHSTDTR